MEHQRNLLKINDIMKVCFVDAVCWIALLNKSEKIHQHVDIEYKKLLKNGYKLITTTAVLNETANALCAPAFRSAVSNFYYRIKASSRIKVIFVDELL